MASVLIVDDSATNRAVLAEALADAHRVFEASNGAEGIGLARVERPDVVITDVLMPKVDGYQLLRDLRGDPHTSSVPVIVHTSAYEDDEVLRIVGHDPHTFVLPKPSTSHAIVAAVATGLAAAQHPRRDPGGTWNGETDAGRDQLSALNTQLLAKVRALQLADRERERLLAQLVHAQEEERERIAADIHDDSIQVLTAASMRLELLGRALKDPASLEQHAKLRETVTSAIARLRRLLFQLRPPELDREGLARALEVYLEHTADEVGYRYEVHDRTERQPAPAVRVLLYRIAQEALVNVAKHARASSVQVLLDEDEDGYVMRVVDDGAGFVPDEVVTAPPVHLGLSSMRQRAELAGGRCRIDSSPGRGTHVEVRIPRRDVTADTTK
ncbi:MAG: response regulator [Actinobacteria bacterium]|nr:response regulator [Actinomycetota bacterium]